MNPDQVRPLLEAMKQIEQGGATPLLGGEVGRYLLAYARERNDALSPALGSDLPIRRDQGAITVERVPLAAVLVVVMGRSTSSRSRC